MLLCGQKPSRATCIDFFPFVCPVRARILIGLSAAEPLQSTGLDSFFFREEYLHVPIVDSQGVSPETRSGAEEEDRTLFPAFQLPSMCRVSGGSYRSEFLYLARLRRRLHPAWRS